MTKIEELENKMLEIAQEIAELKKGQNAGESSELKLNNGDEYWFINDVGEINWSNYDCTDIYDQWRIKNIPLFKTREECQKYYDYRKALIEKSYKFSREEWENDNIPKFIILYDHDDKHYTVTNWYNSQLVGAYYFKTNEDAQFMIDNYSEEMLKWGLL